LTESEIRYLMAVEWACTAEDIVWRRSKLGLRLSASEIAAIDHDAIDDARLERSLNIHYYQSGKWLKLNRGDGSD